MTSLYPAGVVTTFQFFCAAGAIVCGVLAVRELSRTRSAGGSGRPSLSLSPRLVYCMGLLVGCMLAQVAKRAQQPPTTLETAAVHTSVVALLVLVWGICSSYQRLWSHNHGFQQRVGHDD